MQLTSRTNSLLYTMQRTYEASSAVRALVWPHLRPDDRYALDYMHRMSRMDDYREQLGWTTRKAYCRLRAAARIMTHPHTLAIADGALASEDPRVAEAVLMGICGHSVRDIASRGRFGTLWDVRQRQIIGRRLCDRAARAGRSDPPWAVALGIAIGEHRPMRALPAIIAAVCMTSCVALRPVLDDGGQAATAAKAAAVAVADAMPAVLATAAGAAGSTTGPAGASIGAAAGTWVGEQLRDWILGALGVGAAGVGALAMHERKRRGQAEVRAAIAEKQA